ncbi:MAG: filamentous hemagglutinin N-terminal domain-containing protein, partial [Cyanobacteria bacterium J06650_10]
MEQIKRLPSIAGRATIGLAIGSWLAIMLPGTAQITPDDTLPNPSSVESGCTRCLIEGGTQQNNNLFHSFTEFSVPTGGEAVFNNALGVENIVSRITGNAVSEIDGLLQTQGTANLFLLNPNGILFGPNAQLDIGGSLTVSTADSLVFTNGETFSATNPEVPPLLTVSTRLGLQYGSLQNSEVPLSRGPIINQGNLFVNQDLTLIGSELEIQGQLYAGNHLKLIATDNIVMEGLLATSAELANAGDVSLLAGGDIAVEKGSRILANGLTGGNILLQSDGIITATGSSTFSSTSTATTPSTNRGSVTFLADSVWLLGEQVLVESLTTGEREGSPIMIRANDTVTLDGSSLFAISDEAAAGASGNVSIMARKLNMVGGGNATSLALGEGNAGNIDVTAAESATLAGVTSDGGAASSLVSSAGTGAQGEGGNISISTPQLSVTDGAALITGSFGRGNAGDVVIAADEVLFDGVSPQLGQFPSSIITTANEGNGGDIKITGWALTLRDGAQFLSSTESTGGGIAGDVFLNLADTVTLDGGNPLRTTLISVITLPGSEGNGGNIQVETRDLLLSNEAQLIVATTGSGTGGNITVNSQTFSVKGRSLVNAASGQEGKAGNITANTDVLSLDDLSAILTDTTRSQGGDITLTIQKVLLLRNGSDISTTAGRAAAGGDGGNIKIDAAEGVIV